MAVKYDIVVRCDRDYYLPISVQTSQNNPAGLSGYLCVMTVKKSVVDSDASALFKGQPWSSNLSFGQMTFKIPRGTNNAWYVGSGPIASSIVYDVTVQDTATVANWTTLVEGNVTVIPPVTKTVP